MVLKLFAFKNWNQPTILALVLRRGKLSAEAAVASWNQWSEECGSEIYAPHVELSRKLSFAHIGPFVVILILTFSHSSCQSGGAKSSERHKK